MSRSSKAVALKGLPASTWARLERRARLTGRSLSATAADALRSGLGEATDEDARAAEMELARIKARRRKPVDVDVAALIREDRDRR